MLYLLKEYFINNSFTLIVTWYSELLLFILLMLILLSNLKILINFFKQNFKHNEYFIMLVIFVFWVFTRLYFFDNSHSNVYDELLYIQHSRELIDFHQILTPIRSIWRSFILTLPFLLFWISSFVWFLFSIFIWSLSSVLFYILIKILFFDKKTAFFTSLFYSILPFNIFWSIRMETNLSSLFMILLTVISYFLFQKTKNINIFYLSIILTIFSTTFRWENIIALYITLLLLSLLNFKKIFFNLKIFFKSLFLFLFWFILALPNYLNQYKFVNSQDWSYWEKINILDNLKYFKVGFLENHLFFYYNYLALLGIIYFVFLLYKKKIDKYLLCIFTIPFLTIFLIYNSIWLKFVWWTDRLYMEVYPIYILFFWLWIIFLFNILEFKIKNNKFKYIIFSLLVILTLWNIFNISSYIKNSDYKVLQTVVSNKFQDDIYDKDCLYILFDNEYYTAFTNLNYTYSYEFLENKNIQESIFNNFQCVVFVDDKYCYDTSRWENFKSPEWISSINYCNDVKEKFYLSKIKIYEYNNLKYWFYKILWKNINL